MVVTIQEDPPINPNLRHFTVRIDNIHSIKTIVTYDNSVVQRWIRRTLRMNDYLYRTNCLVIGLAIRPTPLLINATPLATIQLFIRNSCLIYQLRHAANAPTILRNFLRDPRITFVSLWPRPNMVTRLLASHPSFRLFYNMPIDVRFFIRDHQGNPLNEARIYEIATDFLGFNIQPELRNVEYSDWEVMELTNAQVAQACLDAFVPYNIGMRVRVWNSNRNLFFFHLLLVWMCTILMQFIGVYMNSWSLDLNS